MQSEQSKLSRDSKAIVEGMIIVKILSVLTVISHILKCDTEEMPVCTLLLETGGTIIIIQHMWTLFHTAEDIRLHCKE